MFDPNAVAVDATGSAPAAAATATAAGKPVLTSPPTVPAIPPCAATAAAVGDSMLGDVAALGPVSATAAAAMDTVAGMEFDHFAPGPRGPLQTEPPLPPPLATPTNNGAGMSPALTPTPGVSPQQAVLVPEPAATAVCFEDSDSHEAHQERSAGTAHGAMTGARGHIDDDG